jgi:hypothetical protein
MPKTTLGALKELLGTAGVDSLGWSYTGKCYIARRGFFYTFGKTSADFAARIQAALPAAKIIRHYEKRTTFRGGASLASSSHFGVLFTIKEDPCENCIENDPTMSMGYSPCGECRRPGVKPEGL